MQKILQMVASFLGDKYLEMVLFFVLITALAVWSFPLVYSAISIAFFFSIVVTLNGNFILNGVQKGLHDISRKPLSALLIFICTTLLVIWNISLDSSFFLILFICFVLYKWDSRVLATGALISLAACPFLLILDQGAYAEQTAVYAYYFLVMTVFLQLIDLKRHPEEYQE